MLRSQHLNVPILEVKLIETPQDSHRNSPRETEEKYKTELCRNWEVGHCEFGEKCVFAHGQEELRSKSYAKNYRTKPCKQFYALGYCLYGARCLFSHHKSSRLPVFVAIELKGENETLTS